MSSISPVWAPLLTALPLQSIEFNPATFSPELQVKVGKIVKMPDAADASVHIKFASQEEEKMQPEDEAYDESADVNDRELSKADRRRLMREALMEDLAGAAEVVQIAVADFDSSDYRLVA